MKAKTPVLLLLLFLLTVCGFEQEKSRKQLREEKKIEKQKQIDSLVNTREFVFVARTALPTGYKTVNLTTTTNYVRFRPDLIESYMPFYGRAYSGVGYGGDAGLKFEGKPEEYTFTKGKKNYQITSTVKGTNDTYMLTLSVSFGGSASLTINSNNRSVISYNGEIEALRKTEGKK
jgi:hypothetical protein